MVGFDPTVQIIRLSLVFLEGMEGTLLFFLSFTWCLCNSKNEGIFVLSL